LPECNKVIKIDNALLATITSHTRFAVVNISLTVIFCQLVQKYFAGKNFLPGQFLPQKKTFFSTQWQP